MVAMICVTSHSGTYTPSSTNWEMIHYFLTNIKSQEKCRQLTVDTIRTISESPVQKDVIWAGSDDGLMHVTQNGGDTWTNVTKNIPGLPP